MALKDDEILKELDTKLSLHCRDNNYSLVISIMAEGEAISCNGNVVSLSLNILAFTKAIEDKTKYPFRKILMKLLKQNLATDSNLKSVH